MRISDWSSDVCSSDLSCPGPPPCPPPLLRTPISARADFGSASLIWSVSALIRSGSSESNVTWVPASPCSLNHESICLMCNFSRLASRKTSTRRTSSDICATVYEPFHWQTTFIPSPPAPPHHFVLVLRPSPQ